MSRSVDLSVPGWLRRVVAVGVLVLLTVPVLRRAVALALDVLGVSAGGPLVVVLAAAVCATAGAVLCLRAGGGDDGGSVWEAIPDRQYTGRYAESGGITRSEQERALETLRDGEE